MSASLIGTRIRTQRESQRLKQGALAATCGISSSYLNLIEHNKRRIGGKLLQKIAHALQVDVQELANNSENSRTRALRLAAEEGEAPVEKAQLEEFITRFPGWAQLLADLRQRTTQLDRIVDTLSDRLAHDPFLSESLHEILSSVTAIHATSGILAQTQDMEPLQTRRFQNNIHDESARLSELSQGLVQYFDHLSEGEQNLSTPLDELVALLDALGDGLSMLDPDQELDSASLIAAHAPFGLSRAASIMIEKTLVRLVDDRRRLPEEVLSSLSGTGELDPVAIAARSGASVDIVLRRLAFRSQTRGQNPFGFIECDGTGAITLRKDLPGFALPRYGAGCALWPLYSALARPNLVDQCDLELPTGQVFEAYGFASYLPAASISAPPVVRSSMIFRLRHRQSDQPTRPVGSNCRICPRSSCESRREPSIHS